MPTKLTFCMKCGQSWTPNSKPKCVCNGKNTGGTWGDIPSLLPHNLPSFEDLKDSEGGQNVKKKNHYRGQFTKWKPTFMVSTTHYIDYGKAVKDHYSGKKPITFAEYKDLQSAMAVNVLIAEMMEGAV